ncbi:MAG: replicative DNA helicase [Acidimicrobiales bacterium]
MVQALDDRSRRSRTPSGADASQEGGPGAGVARLGSRTHRLPPHDLDAEESLLGAMLLSSDAVVAAIEACNAADFYKPAHGLIFTAVVSLFEAGEPVDAVTVADELRRSGSIELIGDPTVLVSLQANTPSLANAAHYAHIVEEHALLRRLIGVAGELAELGYSVPDDVTAAVDEAERMVFDLAERRTTDSVESLRNLIGPSLDRIEELSHRTSRITGVATGYGALDDILAGLQPQTLTIVGARPAMGKALALDTPVPTPSGWTTMGSIRVGDELYDDAGCPCRVTYRSPVFTDRLCFRLRFDDGSSLVADADHRWFAYDYPAWRSHRAQAARLRSAAPVDRRFSRDQSARRRLPQVLTTKQMLDAGVRRGDGRLNWYVPLAGALEGPELDLPVDPYVLGCRLADATRGVEAPADGQDSAHVAAELEARGDRPDPRLEQRATMRIPAPYLRASFKQRLELLQGILDVGGTVTDASGTVALCLVDRGLLEQAWELVCSLGHRPHPIERSAMPLVGGGTAAAWRFCWMPRDPVFRMPRNAAPLAASTSTPCHGRHTRRAIVAIEPVATVPVRCISVDSPSHLFLAGHCMTPTHNTSFALGMLAHVGAVLRRPALLFSLEMGHLELTQRLLASEARVDAQRMRTGQSLHDAEWAKVGAAVSRLSESTIFIDENPYLTVMDIRARARRLKKSEGDLGIVIVDYLQLMTGRHGAESRQVEVAEISRGLKILARELECPVVALSQLSRGLEARQDKRPMLSDLRESGSLEQDADVVLFIYREEIYDPETPIDRRGMAEVIVAKHRNGPTGAAHLVFLSQYARFDNLQQV